MATDPLQWHCEGPDPRWCDEVAPLLPAVGAALHLQEDFFRVAILAEESSHDEPCWFTFLPGPPDSAERRALELHCSSASFAPLRRRGSGGFPERQVWEAEEGAWVSENSAHVLVDPGRAAIFLHHNLLLAQDLVRGIFSISSVPRGQVEAFQAAWEVVIDGRLARTGRPGFPLAERRAQFSRLFSSAGVLLPDHWQVFQALWDGGLASGRDVIAVLRQLPRL